jgi:hypothetical protein
MALRDKLAERSAPFLAPGERIQAVMCSQTGPSPYFGLLSYLILFAVRRRIIVATDRSVLVLKAGSFAGTTAKEVLQRLPRTTQIGPVSGLWAKVHLGGEKMYIHKRFHQDVARADQVAANAAAAAQPPAAPVPPPAPQG